MFLTAPWGLGTNSTGVPANCPPFKEARIPRLCVGGMKSLAGTLLCNFHPQTLSDPTSASCQLLPKWEAPRISGWLLLASEAQPHGHFVS